ncbi:response regulator [Pseudoxanthomonas dokdonensis]|uniref:LuxR family transcriptional regulator n=1 Tax=Pseudoxanthomonas dokdonensis TaxID=344882 RepID=A0A0R0CLY0_9GAMM|nr:response regulator transcription factor [Pseudoxanthomonas dokdonensis]KRG70571.1 LuxR family transcriptional regulator [Pseudoxanthomonas dokdonensis]
MTIRILTVDDHPVLREGIAAMLSADDDLDVVAGAGSAESGLEAFRQYLPDITLMDLQMPGMGGLLGVRALRAEFPHARVVVLTTYRGDGNAREAMAAGACGYLLKNALRSELVDCIRKVHAGRRYVSAEVCADIAEHVGEETLTAREQHILQLLAAGLANKQMANQLDISAETIKSHLARIFEKLGARNRTEAIHIAMRRGMLNQPVL